MNHDSDPTPRQDAPDERKMPTHYVTSPAPRKSRSVSLTAAVGALVTAIILSVLATFALTVRFHRNPADILNSSTDASTFSDLDMIDKLFRSLSVHDLDDRAMAVSVLKAYVAATGDRYAEYFTAEEYQDQISEQNGEMCGIGVSVINDLVTVGDMQYQAILVANVYPDSPAMEAGVLPGDAIVMIRDGDESIMIHDIGYTEALERMRGEEGSEIAFTVWRKKPDGGENGYDSIPMTATRRKLTMQSVMSHVCAMDAHVGVVRITGFDNTTAAQFQTAMDELIASGCTSFVFDMRNNGGGLLTAVEDVLTFFLQKDDVMLYTRDKKGNKDTFAVTVENGKVTSGSGQYTEADVGKYRGYAVCVLVNGNTASAAELFTANMRDHKLGTVVGTNTFGKGTMQTTYSLKSYGVEGALKLTTRYYDPPSGVNYDGPDNGIHPDDVVELSEEAQKINLYLLSDEMDHQLQAALTHLRRP